MSYFRFIFIKNLIDCVVIILSKSYTEQNDKKKLTLKYICTSDGIIALFTIVANNKLIDCISKQNFNLNISVKAHAKNSQPINFFFSHLQKCAKLH